MTTRATIPEMATPETSIQLLGFTPLLPLPAEEVLFPFAKMLGFPSSFKVYGLLSTLNGPADSTVAVKVPFIFEGSRHESEQVPPQPYSKLKVWSYVPSLLLICSFGAGALLPLSVM